MTRVTQSQAVALKEAGYDFPTNKVYAQAKDDKYILVDAYVVVDYNSHCDEKELVFSAPFLFEAATWLRESKGLHVCAQPTAFNHYEPRIWMFLESDSPPEVDMNNENYPTHDLALSASIDRALLIDKERTK